MLLSFLETLRERRNPWLIGAAAVAAALIIVGAIAWYTLRESPPLFAAAEAPAAAGGGGGDGAGMLGDDSTPALEPLPIYIHVAGAVNAPGVYKLAEGQRVVDAIAAAGGGTADAAINSINLAQALTDGQRLYVPTKREAQGTQPGGTYSGGKPFVPPGSGGSADGSGGQAIINVNTASKEELDRIPGIGPVIAERIILYRTVNGPFKAVEDLTKVSGIGDKKLQDLKPHLTVR